MGGFIIRPQEIQKKIIKQSRNDSWYDILPTVYTIFNKKDEVKNVKKEFNHISVMLEETIDSLNINANNRKPKNVCKIFA